MALPRRVLVALRPDLQDGETPLAGARGHIPWLFWTMVWLAILAAALVGPLAGVAGLGPVWGAAAGLAAAIAVIVLLEAVARDLPPTGSVRVLVAVTDRRLLIYPRGLFHRAPEPALVELREDVWSIDLGRRVAFLPRRVHMLIIERPALDLIVPPNDRPQDILAVWPEKA